MIWIIKLLCLAFAFGFVWASGEFVFELIVLKIKKLRRRYEDGK